MKPMTLEQILEAFDPIDRPLVSEPVLDGVLWDEREYFAWFHAEAPRAFMVVQLPERDVGLVFRFDKGPARAGTCKLCYSNYFRSGVRFVMVDSWPRPRTSHGIHICGDLDCSDAVRGKKFVDHMRETIPTGKRIERFAMELDRFVRRVTGL